MTSEEKRRLAVQRELLELDKCVRAFDQVVVEAKRLAVDMTAAAARMRRVNDEARIDRAIDQLDYMTKRGKYAETIAEAAERAAIAALKYGDT